MAPPEIAANILNAGSVDNAMTIITNLANEHGIDLDIEVYTQIRQDHAGSEGVIKMVMAITFLGTLGMGNNVTSQTARDELACLTGALGAFCTAHNLNAA